MHAPSLPRWHAALRPDRIGSIGNPMRAVRCRQLRLITSALRRRSIRGAVPVAARSSGSCGGRASCMEMHACTVQQQMRGRRAIPMPRVAAADMPRARIHCGVPTSEFGCCSRMHGSRDWTDADRSCIWFIWMAMETQHMDRQSRRASSG
jgi:hypothetical protein